MIGSRKASCYGLATFYGVMVPAKKVYLIDSSSSKAFNLHRHYNRVHRSNETESIEGHHLLKHDEDDLDKQQQHKKKPPPTMR